MEALLGSLKQAVYPLGSKLVVTASLVHGKLKGTGADLRCLFVHRCNFNDDVKLRTYDGEPTVIRSRRVVIPALREMIRRRRAEFDLCVAVVPSFYGFLFEDLCEFSTRENVRQVIDTSGGWSVVRERFSKKKRQVTNDFSDRYGLSYRTSRDTKDFDHFYYRMHLPHIRRRYSDLSQIDSYEDMKRFFERGELLLVTKDDRPVAGALSLLEGKALVFRRSGVLDGDEAIVKGGAQTALYYYQLKYAADHGFEAVDTMKTAPFLNDGVFRHKAEWGARASPDEEARRRVYLFSQCSEDKLAQFFDINPMVADAGTGLVGILGDPRPAGAAPAPSDALQRRYHTRGLCALRVYGPQGARTVALAAETARRAQPRQLASGS